MGFPVILKISAENYNFTVLCIQIQKNVSLTLVFGVVGSSARDKEPKYGFI
jgi:hypothetical protein